MKIFDEREQVKRAIRQWIEQYGPVSTYGADNRGRSVGAELMALDQDTATSAQVNEIIGSAWVSEYECGECGKKSWRIVEIGQEPDYESATAYLCADCLRSALQLLGVAIEIQFT